MAVTSYKDLSWGEEPISPDKLNTMVANSRYLFERMPKVVYNAYGLNKDTNTKIACGTYEVSAPVQTSTREFNISFGTFFTPGCKPIISIGVRGQRGRTIATFYGFDGPASAPDNRGMVAKLSMAEFTPNAFGNVFNTPMTIHWIAIGY